MPPTPESPLPTAPAPLSQRLLAWGVHAFTMSGLAFATLALLAMNHDQIAWMWLWVAFALVVEDDAGTLARPVRGQEVVP